MDCAVLLLKSWQGRSARTPRQLRPSDGYAAEEPHTRTDQWMGRPKLWACLKVARLMSERMRIGARQYESDALWIPRIYTSSEL